MRRVVGAGKRRSSLPPRYRDRCDRNNVLLVSYLVDRAGLYGALGATFSAAPGRQ